MPCRCFLQTAVLGIVIALVARFLRYRPAEPIFGVYAQPGRWYWLKYCIFYATLRIRKLWGRLIGNKMITRRRTGGFGYTTHATEREMDIAQELSTHPKAFDAVFFITASKEGFYLEGGCERRHDGFVNGLFYVAVPGKGLLCSNKLPDTLLRGAKPNTFGAEGITFTPIDPMKHWRVEYEGNMWYKEDPSKSSKVSVRGEWKSDLPYFNFDTDLAVGAICRAVCREKWSRERFKALEEAHQTHYEQMGSMKTSIKIDGEAYEFQGQAFRDHSYGFKRDWTLMHRYAYHTIFLEDGTMATVCIVSQPSTTSLLETGCVYEPDGSLHAVEWCDLQLYQYGENGVPPVDYGFSFQAGERVYRVQVEVEYESMQFMGADWKAKMEERFVRYTVNNKIKGTGTVQWQYQHKGGRKSK